MNVYEFKSQREEESSQFSHNHNFGSSPFPPMLGNEWGSRGSSHGSIDPFSTMENLIKGFGFRFGDESGFPFSDDPSQDLKRKADINRDPRSKDGKQKLPPKGFISGSVEDV